VAKTKANLDDERLVDEYIEPKDLRHGGRADARTRSGVPVWALIGYKRATGGDVDRLASSYDLPREEVEAALAYYRRNKAYIDARLLLNSD
jgi:uncharacterized protein (DUF433 family)